MASFAPRLNISTFLAAIIFALSPRFRNVYLRYNRMTGGRDQEWSCLKIFTPNPKQIIFRGAGPPGPPPLCVSFRGRLCGQSQLIVWDEIANRVTSQRRNEKKSSTKMGANF